MKSFLNKPFGHGIRKAAILTAAIASLTAASASWAAPISFDNNKTFVHGSESGLITKTSAPSFMNKSVKAGEFEFKVTTAATVGGATWAQGSLLQAFCIDVNNNLHTPFSYNISAATQASDLGSFTQLQFAQVNWLFDTQLSGLATSPSSLKDAAFQLALWEILFEPGSSKNLNNGSFFAPSGSGSFSSAVKAQANSLLSGITTNANYKSTAYDFYVLDPAGTNNPDNQKLITWKPKDPGNPNEVSEPGTLLLLSIGLGGVLFSIRRRNGLQFASLA